MQLTLYIAINKELTSVTKLQLGQNLRGIKDRNSGILRDFVTLRNLAAYKEQLCLLKSRSSL